MKRAATAALVLLAAVAAYFNAVAVGAFYRSITLPDRGDTVDGIVVLHPVAPTPLVLAFLMGIALLTTLSWGVTAYSSRKILRGTKSFAISATILAVAFLLFVWIDLSSTHF